VGGDFFNYFSMPDKAMGLLIGDVSGKGLPTVILLFAGSCKALTPVRRSLISREWPTTF
jgi:serine phosphatase RsbU (regulator of sigma subunit)